MRPKPTPNCVIAVEDAVSVPLLLKSKMISVFPDDIYSCETTLLFKFMFSKVDTQPRRSASELQVPKRAGEVDLRACTYKCREKE